MKKHWTLIIAAALMLGFTACENDKEKDLPNTFQVGKTTYKLGAAICYTNSEAEPGLTSYDLYITDKVHWNSDGNWSDIRSDYANSIEINIYKLYVQNGSTTQIPDGKYIYSASRENMTHTGRSDYFLYKADGSGYVDDYINFGQNDVTASKLVIEVKHINSNIYEIKITGGVDEYGNSVNGYYKGAISVYED